MRSKNAARNVISSLLLQVATIVCGFIVPKMIIDAFGSEVNGLITSITQFLAYITLLESGFGPVVKSVLYKPIAKCDKETIARILKTAEKFFRRIAVVFVVYILALAIFFSELMEGQFEYVFTVSLVLIIAMSVFAEYFFGMTYKLYLQAEQKTYVTSYIQTGAIILSAVVVVVFVRLGFNVQVVKLMSALVLVARPLVQNIYVRKKYDIKLGREVEKYEIKQKWDGLAQHVAAVIHSNTDVAVLTLFSTFDEVSVYSVYMLVVRGVKSVVEALNNGVDAAFGDMLARGEDAGQLKRRFAAYELFLHTMSTILFVCAMVLITPFVSVYMEGVTDADYVRPIFGILITVSEFVWAVRLPYSSVTLAAGHFKQTMKGAWVEATVNIILSVVLVFHFGIIGVAIGTIVAMLIRTVEFMWHCSRKILRRRAMDGFRWLIVVALQAMVIFSVCHTLVGDTAQTFVDWVMKGAAVFAITSVVVVTTNIVIFRKDFGELIMIGKRIIKKEKK